MATSHEEESGAAVGDRGADGHQTAVSLEQMQMPIQCRLTIKDEVFFDLASFCQVSTPVKHSPELFFVAIY